MDAFWNKPFDAFTWPDPAAIVKSREQASAEMAAYLLALVGGREAEYLAGVRGKDTVSRLVALSHSGALTDFGMLKVVQNVGGLLIGAVETTSHCVVKAIDYLIRRPDLFAAARSAALSHDPTAVEGFANEALRFLPPFPYFFRMCEQDTLLGRGTGFETKIARGTTVLAVTHSAMFDAAGISNPTAFDPARVPGNQFLLGHGPREWQGAGLIGPDKPGHGRYLIAVRQCQRRLVLVVISTESRGRSAAKTS